MRIIRPANVPAVDPTLTAMHIPEEPTPKPLQIKLFFIAPDDQGKSGKQIGCGDSAVPVTLTIPYTKTPLTEAYRLLLADKNRYYGQSGLYNSLYQSDLTIHNISVENGKALVSLSGKLVLGGVCDNPRVEAQLSQTAQQFPTVKELTILINNVPLQSLLSEK